ncbi:tRNA 2-thiouridine(34) synthase MnmA [Gammaproteobacteria bacterium]|nr:tRNA 2-thiouridine(34) synthase MnmA [Gammaproteobacteria bacterium]
MQTIHKKHIIVGMSGGVDSSVAALILKQQGHHVEGVFMKNWEQDDTDTYCPASIDMKDAQNVCDNLGIELHRVNFSNEYWEHVFTYFLNEYKAGRTPNPDILCNKEIKFKAFLNYAKGLGADAIATGHYAQIIKNNNETLLLLKGLDQNKDQSYFLHALSSTQLSESIFPIGNLQKQTVREIAEKAGFKNHQKKDSTGICFIGERKFKAFLNDFLPAKSGDIITTDGEYIGKHDGMMFYTIGQRQGLNIGGRKNHSEDPWYVSSKNIEDNTLIVAQGKNHPSLYATTLIASNMSWINTQPNKFSETLSAKTRYRQSDQPCIINKLNDNNYQIEFETPQWAITPGQYIVFYQNNVCLGGGIIIQSK